LSTKVKRNVQKEDRDQDRNNSLERMACRRKKGKKLRMMNSRKTGIDEEAPLFNDQNESGNVTEEEEVEVEKKQRSQQPQSTFRYSVHQFFLISYHQVLTLRP
jgi:hypothetical protein